MGHLRLFATSFNQQLNWVSGITMGLNQAPQTVRIESGRTGLIWGTVMSKLGVGFHNL